MRKGSIAFMKHHINQEIKAVAELKDEAWRLVHESAHNEADRKQYMTSFFRLTDRLNGLFYARHIMTGDMELAQCYETVREWRNSDILHNSGGAKI